MENEKTIAQIVQELDASKDDFLDNTQQKIASWIKSQSVANCLTFVLRNNAGGIHQILEPAASLIYAKCLLAFLREQKFEKHEVDSLLTDGVVNMVIGEFEQLYEANQERIGNKVLAALLRDDVFRNGLSTQIVNSFSGTLPEILKRKAMTVVLQKMDSAIGHSVENTVSKGSITLIKQTIAAPIGHKLAYLLIKILATNLKVIIAKFLASAAFKAAITAAIKKLVVAVVLSAMIKFIAAKLGISAAGAYALFLIPLIATYLAYEAYSLPENLAKKISEQIKTTLASEYGAINQDIASNIVNNIMMVGASWLIGTVMHNNEFQSTLHSFWEEIRDEIKI